MNTLTELSGAVTTGVQDMVEDIVTSTQWGLLVERWDLLVERWDLPKIVFWDLFSFTSTSWEFYAIIFLWLLVILWVIKDSNYRSHSTGFVIFSLVLVTLGTPLIWLPVYLAIRPLGYKYERSYWKSVMTQWAEDEEEYSEEYSINEIENTDTDTDEDHLAELKKKATVAKRRVSKNAPSTTKKPSSTSKPKPSSAPKAKKPSARSAQ